METKIASLAAGIAGYFTELFNGNEDKIAKMDFYGSGFTMKRLGFIALPAILREKIRKIKDGLNMENGPYPPRKDGGYGWFIVSEKETENESLDAAESGCNIMDGGNGSVYYFWIGKYFKHNIWNNSLCWLYTNNIITKAENRIIADNALTDDDRVRLLKDNLIVKDGNKYKLNFAVFSRTQYDRFKECFNNADTRLDGMLRKLIKRGVSKSLMTVSL